MMRLPGRVGGPGGSLAAGPAKARPPRRAMNWMNSRMAGAARRCRKVRIEDRSSAVMAMQARRRGGKGATIACASGRRNSGGA
jgi:hypothetical protein